MRAKVDKIPEADIRMTKNINLTVFYREPSTGEIRIACVMMGSGDEGYMNELMDLLVRYMNDPNVTRCIEI